MPDDYQLLGFEKVPPDDRSQTKPSKKQKPPFLAASHPG
jgi:hypothetical protein